MKNSGSSEQLDADGDTASEVSSEVSFSYEFAQTEVMMKALGNNGKEALWKIKYRYSAGRTSVRLVSCLCFLTPLCHCPVRPHASSPPVSGEAA